MERRSIIIMGIHKDKQIKQDDRGMRFAEASALDSHDIKYKVGAVIVRDGHILADGYNGTPSGHCNHTRDPYGKTLSTVLHAEANALMKAGRAGLSCVGATVYTTHSPCLDCAKLIYQAGIKRVVYKEKYRGTDWIKIKDLGIKLEKY